jgi:hypothetical protein
MCMYYTYIIKRAQERKGWYRMSKYRFESGSVYEYSAEQNAYIFIAKLNGRTRAQFIREYESN